MSTCRIETSGTDPVNEERVKNFDDFNADDKRCWDERVEQYDEREGHQNARPRSLAIVGTAQIFVRLGVFHRPRPAKDASHEAQNALDAKQEQDQEVELLLKARTFVNCVR